MTDFRVTKGGAQEDQLTAAIETYTSQVPSSFYLGLALTSMAVSVGFQLAGKKDTSLFIGQWAAPFMILGLYNKLVKQHGSDGTGEDPSAEALRRRAIDTRQDSSTGFPSSLQSDTRFLEQRIALSTVSGAIFLGLRSAPRELEQDSWWRIM